MTVDEGFAYIESFTNLEKTPGSSMRPYRLDRMHVLLEHFGNPHEACATVHIAGSKGKGSTAAFIASILASAGFTTGLYTSPHVSSYKERITLAGNEVPDGIIVEQIEAICAGLRTMNSSRLSGKEEPTTFELLTLLGFLVFRRLGCSWAVIETGIGGRLDATNLVTPRASVITPVELEHTEILGDTLEKIAGEKAGIIKRETPVFVGYQHAESERVLTAAAEAMRAPLRLLRRELESVRWRLDGAGTHVDYRWSDGVEESFRLRMFGGVQGENAALAALAGRALLESVGVGREERLRCVREGLAAARLPGRLELIRETPPIFIDGAHTPVSVARLVESFEALFPPPRVLVFGSVLGKNAAAMAEILSPHFEHIIVSTPGTFKRSDPGAVFAEFRKHRATAALLPNPADALARALSVADGRLPILVSGSFYMIGDIRRLVRASAGAVTAPA